MDYFYKLGNTFDSVKSYLVMCVHLEGPFVDSWGSFVETLIFIFKLKI